MKDIDLFHHIEDGLSRQLDKMLGNNNTLFYVDVDPDVLWKLYLDSFPEGTNPIYHERTEHDCSACRHFIKSFGNVIAIKDNKIISLWDFEIPGSRYDPVLHAMSDLIRSCKIGGLFVTKTSKYGVMKDYEQNPDGVTEWGHFYIELPGRAVLHGYKEPGKVQSDAQSQKDVFSRSLNEISDDAVKTVLEIISQNSLYKGEEWKGALNSFLNLKTKYQACSEHDRDAFLWEQSQKAGPAVSKIKNHSIGVLLSDITSGLDLDKAVQRYEKIVAPNNYKRPKTIFTKQMLEDAERTITELGYLESLGRRYACLGDITVNNILFVNRDVAKDLKQSNNVFEEMSKDIAINPKKYDKVEEIPIGKFVDDVLPGVHNIEVLLENRHSGNFVSLVAPSVPDSKPMLKWDNNFSWAYNGNISDSMKERVKSAGGKVDGVLRFSIQWNEHQDNNNDFDAHCVEPHGNRIYFRNKGCKHPSSGMLDVDIIDPVRQIKNGVAVENITYSDLHKMPNGIYAFSVHNYTHRGGKSGFSAEIEFDGEIYSFDYNKELRYDEYVQVVQVEKSPDGFKIVRSLPSSVASRKVWNLDTNQFHPVQIVMMSPNYWDGQTGIGNKHYFFMLKGCKNEQNPNGFYNEYLKEDLLEHKRVFEALGAKMSVAASDDQLSGLGFSSTQHNYIIVRVEGHVSRTLKITF